MPCGKDYPLLPTNSPEMFGCLLYGLLQIQDKELQRNRTCVLDIHKYTDYSQDQLEEFLYSEL